MKHHLLSFAILAGLFATASWAADEKPTQDDKEAIHKELIKLREDLTKAVREGDLEKQLEYVTNDVVITWQKGKPVKGKEALKTFMKENMGTTQKVFKGYSQEPTATEPTILYGDKTGVCYGTSVARYSLLGNEFELENQWTTTLVKEDDGKWRIASYHVSADILKNPVLNAAKQSLAWVGAIAAIVGLLVGVVVTKIVSRPKPSGV